MAKWEQWGNSWSKCLIVSFVIQIAGVHEVISERLALWRSKSTSWWWTMANICIHLGRWIPWTIWLWNGGAKTTKGLLNWVFYLGLWRAFEMAFKSFEKQLKQVQKSSLRLLPKNPKLQIIQTFWKDDEKNLFFPQLKSKPGKKKLANELLWLRIRRKRN